MLPNTTIVIRGATVQFTTTFYDFNGAIVQPDSATINLVYPMAGGGTGTAAIAMTPPTSPAVTWTAQWDTRGIAPGTVSGSVHTGTNDPIPVAASDFTFQLAANPANLLTF